MSSQEFRHRDGDYSLRELIDITRGVIAEFDRVERRRWGVEASTIELMKQVGELAKRVMVVERYYLGDRDLRPEYRSTTAEIGDELADILYCVIRIADHYGIDLEASHLEARRREVRYLGKEPDF